MKSQHRGGTIVGFIVGLIVGLGAALAVAVYVTKVPVPFMNKGAVRNGDNDEAEARKNRDWNVNAPLAGKTPAKVTAPPASAAASGAVGAAPDARQAAASAAKPAASTADIKAMSFETALKELETIVGRLEKGDVALEESITIYERGEALKRRCEELLKAAEARVEKITTGSFPVITFNLSGPVGQAVDLLGTVVRVPLGQREVPGIVWTRAPDAEGGAGVPDGVFGVLHIDNQLAAALRGRLKQSAEAIKEFTRGRSVDELSAGEVNILAKIVKTE